MPNGKAVDLPSPELGRLCGPGDFVEVVDLIRPGVGANFDECLDLLWRENPGIHRNLRQASSLEEARSRIFTYLESRERSILLAEEDLYALDRASALDCIRMVKNIFGPINEKRCKDSALRYLWQLARRDSTGRECVASVGFVLEFINLFRGMEANLNIYPAAEERDKSVPAFLQLEGREAAVSRSWLLDRIGREMSAFMRRYPSGLEEEVIRRRRENRERILRYFGGTEEDWQDPVWQIRHVVRDAAPLLELIELSPDQREAVELVGRYGIPFGITPYYLSLMDQEAEGGRDHAVRAQVLPPLDYVLRMAAHRKDRDTAFDFMGEHETSPIDLVTRRYPGVAILKPFNTCAQICVYCQRNWEIDQVLDSGAMAAREKIDEAMDWFRRHECIGEVLITGGDPCVMTSRVLENILAEIAAIDHIYRIRIGTRTPVVLPMRWGDDYVRTIAGFHEPGRREIAVVTHFEHPYEITPEAMSSIRKIKRAGISLYNQQVFTFENSRRFETVKLRQDLRKIGVDPYYTFNMKGKEETRRYIVPIARLLQERKEEARLLPGLDRTDEPVFNLPKLGKNHLRASQDRRLVMIKPDGSRVYEFHPWEKNIRLLPPYNHRDVSIYEYLLALAQRGENLRDYRTIWYYY